jgi:hypothetical protein
VGQRPRRQRRRAQEKPCPKTTGGYVKAAATTRPARFELFRITDTKRTSSAASRKSLVCQYDCHVKPEYEGRGLTRGCGRPTVVRPSARSMALCSMLTSHPRRPSPQGRDRRALRLGLAWRSSAAPDRAAPAGN